MGRAKKVKYSYYGAKQFEAIAYFGSRTKSWAYDTDGNLLDSNMFTGIDFVGDPNSIKVDIDRAVYCTGGSNKFKKFSSNYTELIDLTLTTSDTLGRGIGVDSTTKDFYLGVYYTAGNDLLKYNSSGVFQWGKNYSTNAFVTDNSKHNNGVVIVGINWTGATRGIRLVDSDGNTTWTYTTINGTPNCVKSDTSGKIYVGTQPSSNDVIVLDASGNLLWEKSTGSNTRAIGCDTQGNVYAGTSGGSLIKYDSSGNVLNTISGLPGIYSLDCDGDDNVYIGTQGNTNNIRSYDSAGNLRWQKSVSGNISVCAVSPEPFGIGY